MPKKEMNTLVVGTNEYEIVDSTARSSISSKQDTLVSGTNIKTVNNNSLLGSGNINISGGENNVIESISVNNTPQTVTNKNVNITVPTATSDLTNDSNFVASSNLKTINSNSLVGSGDITVQPTLVSGTNIKTVNNESLLGSGNISISVPTYIAGTGIDITSNTISADVTGIKGDAESTYRVGNVNLTPANIGAQPILTTGNGITISNNTISVDDTYINNLIATYINALDANNVNY